MRFFRSTEAIHPGTTVLVDISDPTADGGGCGSPDNPCNTIPTGITHANPGDTVSVAGGTYTGSFSIPKALTLIASEGPGNTFIIGGGIFGYAITITGNPDGVVIDGFDISNPAFVGLSTESTAVSVGGTGARNLTIRNNVIHDVRSSTIPDCGFVGALGLALNNVGQSGTTLIQNNRVYSINNDGCNSVGFPHRSMARGIWVSGANSGFGSGLIKIIDNEIVGLSAFRPAAIDVLRSDNFLVANNSISDMTATNDTGPTYPTFSTGVHPDRSNGDPAEGLQINITENAIDGAGAGIRFEQAADVYAAGNTFTNLTSPSATFAATNAVFDTATGNIFCGNTEDKSKGNVVLQASTGNYFLGGTDYSGNNECPSGLGVPVQQVLRIAGDRPLLPALAVSKQRFPSGGATAIVLARDDQLADAFAGGPLTNLLNASLLLTPSASLADETLAEMQRVATTDQPVFLLGGPAALNARVETDLVNAGFTNLARLGGNDRNQTATTIGEAILARSTTPVTQATLVENRTFVDGLSASSVARLILFGERGSASLPPSTANFLLTHETITTIEIVGGTAALPTGLETNLTSLGKTVAARRAGSDRFATAKDLADAYFTSPIAAVLVNGDAKGSTGLFGALLAGPLAAENNLPLLLTRSNELPDITQDFLNAHAQSIDTVYLIGSTTDISEPLERSVGPLIAP